MQRTTISWAWAEWCAMPTVGRLTATVVASGAMNGVADPWGGVVALAGTVAHIAAVNHDQDGSAVENANAAYVRGEIDEQELERRLELALDPRAERIRETVEQVNGVGPATSAAIASEFESLESVRAANPAELESVNGVGPDRAEAIRDQV